MCVKVKENIENSVLKSGTTIVGIVCKDGIVMASDRQSTAGNVVMSKNAQKTIQINDYLVLSGTGIVSDIKRIEKILYAELKLKELRSRSRPNVKQAANLLAYILYHGIRQFSSIPMQAGFLLGGLNEDGTFELYSIEPAGSVLKVEDYDANFGSGMPYVLGFLERQYKTDISVKEGIELAIEAIKSSTQRDIGSGYGIDVYTITKSGISKAVEQKIVPEYKSSK
ncbi:MAG: proteasome subunit beta [Candidatus Pacearchaeota archaeon]